MPQTWKSQITTAILFLLCGIPGAFAFVFGSLLLFGKLTAPNATDKFPSLIILFAMITIGLLFTMIGVGKLKQWRYAFVFLTIPVSLLLFAVIDNYLHISTGKGIFELAVFVGVATFLVLKLLRWSERNNQKAKKNDAL